jgi:hypothetical protein
MTSPDRTTALDDAEVFEGRSFRDDTFAGFLGQVMASQRFCTQVTIPEFLTFQVYGPDRTDLTADEVAQRSLDPKHVEGIFLYILATGVSNATKALGMDGHVLVEKLGFISRGSFIPAVVCLRKRADGRPSHRIHPVREAGTEAIVSHRMFLPSYSALSLLDGMHRQSALHQSLEYVRHIVTAGRYPNVRLLPLAGDVPEDHMAVWRHVYQVMTRQAYVSLDIHLDTTVKEERELFARYNNYGKKVGGAQAAQYGTDDPINQYVLSEVDPLFEVRNVEPSNIGWTGQTNILSRKDARVIATFLLFGTPSAKNKTAFAVERAASGKGSFWTFVRECAFGHKEAKQRSLLGQPAMLKALAKLYYQLTKLGTSGDLVEYLASEDFSHRGEFAEALIGDGVAHRAEDGLIRLSRATNDLIPVVGRLVRERMAQNAATSAH